MPHSCGIHNLVSGNFLKPQSSRVVTCFLTLSEMAEAMEVHFSVHCISCITFEYVAYSILIGQSQYSTVCLFLYSRPLLCITDRCYGRSSEVVRPFLCQIIDFLSKWPCNKRNNVQLTGHCCEISPFRAMQRPLCFISGCRIALPGFILQQ